MVGVQKLLVQHLHVPALADTMSAEAIAIVSAMRAIVAKCRVARDDISATEASEAMQAPCRGGGSAGAACAHVHCSADSSAAQQQP